MDICQIQTQAEAGGAQRLSHVVGKGLRGFGHKVRTIYLYRKTGACDNEPNATFLVARPLLGYADYLKAVFLLFRELQRSRPEVVLTYQHYGNVLGAMAARVAGTQVVIANQSGLPWESGISKIATTLDLLIGSAGFYTHNVVNSFNTEQAFARYPKKYRQRLARIDHGIELPVRTLRKVETRIRFGLPLEVPLLTSVGRLSVQKNHLVLVEALALLDQAHLAIAGEGPLRAEILRLADNLGVSDRLHLLGEIPHQDVCDLVVAGDVFVFASIWETFGLAVVEAAAIGAPVAASGIPVLREVLSDGQGNPVALFFDPRDPKDAASKISEIINNSATAGTLRQLGQRLREKYSVEQMLALYDALIPW